MLMLGFLGRFSFGLDRPGLMLGLSLSWELGSHFHDTDDSLLGMNRHEENGESYLTLVYWRR